MGGSDQPCCLCSQIAGRPEHDLIASLLPDQPYARRIMLESTSFAAIPSLGPLVPGHSLLCPRRHVRSFALLDDDLAEELAEVRDDLAGRLRDGYGAEVHFFEHGMAPAGDRVVCTVDHAHLHALPLGDVTVAAHGVRATQAGGDGWATFDGSLAGLRRAAGRDEYVMYAPPSGAPRVRVSPHHDIESQYMRRLVASALGRPHDWNWRASPDVHAADATWRAFVGVAP